MDMIEANGLTKRFGATTAVDDVHFSVRPGSVTGFLGPNGAGKSTTMRMIVGLDRPSAGTATVAGRRYRDHRAPLREVGALLDAAAAHRGRSAESHLRAIAATHGIPRRRVREVLAIAGLERVAGKRVGGFSLGMKQRLGIAAALLGDPGVLILDEPVNGLDPEGVRWVRELVRGLAAEGRTVLLSSHLMSEVAQTADHLIVLGRGRVLADEPIGAFLSAGGTTTVVRSPRADELATALGRHATAARGEIARDGADVLRVTGLDAAAVGDLAAAAGIPLHGLRDETRTLEDRYLDMTGDAVDYRSGELTGAAR
jgi:ABC-2 type transport system ATP-binding protein